MDGKRRLRWLSAGTVQTSSIIIYELDPSIRYGSVSPELWPQKGAGNDQDGVHGDLLQRLQQ